MMRLLLLLVFVCVAAMSAANSGAQTEAHTYADTAVEAHPPSGTVSAVPPTDAEQLKFEQLVAWLSSHDSYVNPKLGLAYFDQRRVIVATQNVQADEVLFRLSSSVVLSASRIQRELMPTKITAAISNYFLAQQDVVPESALDKVEEQYERVLFAAFLAYQRHQPANSSWGAFVSLLPSQCIASACLRSEDLVLIADDNTTNLVYAVEHVRSELQHAWDVIEGVFINKVSAEGTNETSDLDGWRLVTFEDFLWAHSIVMSRSWTASDGNLYVLPFADLFNHAGDSTNKVQIYPNNYKNETEVFATLLHTTGVTAGQQVFSWVGNKTNTEFLLSYGWVPPFVWQHDPNTGRIVGVNLDQNLDDAYSLQLGWGPSPHNYLDWSKVHLLQHAGFNITHYKSDPVTNKIDRINRPWFQLAEQLKFVPDTATRLLLFCRIIEADVDDYGVLARLGTDAEAEGLQGQRTNKTANSSEPVPFPTTSHRDHLSGILDGSQRISLTNEARATQSLVTLLSNYIHRVYQSERTQGDLQADVNVLAQLIAVMRTQPPAAAVGSAAPLDTYGQHAALTVRISHKRILYSVLDAMTARHYAVLEEIEAERITAATAPAIAKQS